MPRTRKRIIFVLRARAAPQRGREGIFRGEAEYRGGMKKKILLAVCVILTVCAAAAAFAACNKEGGETPSDISRSVGSLYAGGSDSFAVTVESGVRETPFIADGKVGEVKDFTELSVTPLTVNGYEEIAFVLYGAEEGAESVSGTLTAGTFGEFRGEITLPFAPVKIALTADGQTFELELEDVLDGKLTSADAVNVAKKQFAERIAAEEADGKPAREIYVKLITGDRETYYFYVSFIGEGTDYWAALIDPSDGTVVSHR